MESKGFDKVNYILHFNNALKRMHEDSNIGPLHISLYTAIFSMWNASGWRDYITPSREELCYRAKIGSNNTYHKVLKELNDWGYISYTPSGNQYKASQIACIRFDTSTDTSGDTASDTCTATIYKHINNKTIYTAVIEYLNQKTGKKFSEKTNRTQTLINGRINDGYTLDDFKKVIDAKIQDCEAGKFDSKYLRPETLFNPSKFEAYLNQSTKIPSQNLKPRIYV